MHMTICIITVPHNVSSTLLDYFSSICFLFLFFDILTHFIPLTYLLQKTLGHSILSLIQAPAMSLID